MHAHSLLLPFPREVIALPCLYRSHGTPKRVPRVEPYQAWTHKMSTRLLVASSPNAFRHDAGLGRMPNAAVGPHRSPPGCEERGATIIANVKGRPAAQLGEAQDHPVPIRDDDGLRKLGDPLALPTRRQEASTAPASREGGPVNTMLGGRRDKRAKEFVQTVGACSVKRPEPSLIYVRTSCSFGVPARQARPMRIACRVRRRKTLKRIASDSRGEVVGLSQTGTSARPSAVVSDRTECTYDGTYLCSLLYSVYASHSATGDPADSKESNHP